ncbi:DUF881 domain-containing protein [Blastococcus tunisiensis]|uniref:Uncharacterized conserved protein YlxW, UPF0749 family n=1 Tax=Blastococcus tunisiensis TaxID=1798228 RepID=A0A1I2J1N7_9ACTN|nr:DUF881 domain-containing protein [Blastococcus sp. DSM 46838]SFF47167.1 Uncharacterized conserved protein YlxW, UPF0749 family [Blastococcus sp. DSM 46838]
MTGDERPDPRRGEDGDDEVVLPHPFGSARGRDAADEPAAVRPADEEPNTGEPPTGEPATGEPAVDEPAVDEPPVDRPPGEEAAAGEPGATADRPAADVPAEGVGTGEQGTGTSARRTRDPLAAVLIGVLTLLLGFAFAVQVRSVGDDQDYAGAREEDLVRILDDLNAREERLRDQIADQRDALEQLTSSDSRSAAALEEARAQAEAIGILNGTVPAQGPGLVITIRDPDGEVRVSDVVDAIQELRGAGAETMQIDDVRVGVSTAVTGTPGDLMVDGRPITSPYEIVVIGSPQNMDTALNIPGGVVQDLNRLGASVTIEQSDQVLVDALRPLDTPQYASPDVDD